MFTCTCTLIHPKHKKLSAFTQRLVFTVTTYNGCVQVYMYVLQVDPITLYTASSTYLSRSQTCTVTCNNYSVR